jgi:large subunit ribosomal protein L23
MENDIYNVLVRPLVTEKGTFQSRALNAYAFEVNPDANKAQIKQAIEKIYSVKVLEVRTANRRGKPRRYGLQRGTTRRWKKAVVLLHPDHHIDLF